MSIASRTVNRSLLLALLLSLLPVLLAAQCGSKVGPPPPGTHQLELGLNGIADELDDLLIVPPSGFVINVSFVEGDTPIDAESLVIGVERWSGTSSPEPLVDLGAALQVAPNGAVGEIPASLALETGTHTLKAAVLDTEGRVAEASFDFSVRDFAGGAPPIGVDQMIWLDFSADRDAEPGPDFPVDLQHFGLGSASSPSLSALVETRVIDAVVNRMIEAYYLADPNGFGQIDPVWISIVTSEPVTSLHVTRICIGGEAQNPLVVGSILIDSNNQNKNSVECGTIPPTGVFVRGLLYYASDPDFQAIFDPIMGSAGGVPVGEHALDAIVLDPFFDPGSASAAELARFDAIELATQAFGDMLGSIVAHETGHALGVVEPGPPGGGIFGGPNGTADFSHTLNPDGSVPSENFLMKAGNTFSFAELAGLNGNPLPYFRPIEHAYLRDRLVQDPSVLALQQPPVIVEFSPSVVTEPFQSVELHGQNYAPTPRMRLYNEIFSYEILSETFQSTELVTAFILKSQVPSGLYELEVTNPDGQKAAYPFPIFVAP